MLFSRLKIRTKMGQNFGCRLPQQFRFKIEAKCGVLYREGQTVRGALDEAADFIEGLFANVWNLGAGLRFADH